MGVTIEEDRPASSLLFPVMLIDQVSLLPPFVLWLVSEVIKPLFVIPTLSCVVDIRPSASLVHTRSIRCVTGTLRSTCKEHCPDEQCHSYSHLPTSSEALVIVDFRWYYFLDYQCTNTAILLQSNSNADRLLPAVRHAQVDAVEWAGRAECPTLDPRLSL